MNIIFDTPRFVGYVRATRGKKTLSQAAADAGVNVATFCKIENGFMPSLAVFIAICQWIGIDPGFFFLDGDQGKLEGELEVAVWEAGRRRLEPFALELAREGELAQV